VKREMRRTGRSFKAAVNDALRRGRGIGGKPVPPKPFRVEPHDFGFKPGVDLDRMNQLADELEVEEVARRMHR
jgi:hypothetical protein